MEGRSHLAQTNFSKFFDNIGSKEIGRKSLTQRGLSTFDIRDTFAILRHFGIEPAVVKRELNRDVENLKTGNSSRPVFSPRLIEWFSSSWLLASVEQKETQIRSGHLITALLLDQARLAGGRYSDVLTDISENDLRAQFDDIMASSSEKAGPKDTPLSGGGGQEAGNLGSGDDSALGQYCINLHQTETMCSC